MSNDMYFDTSDFDFSSLTDVVGLNDAPNINDKNHLNMMGGVVDTIDDLGDNVPLDINQDASDLMVQETEDNREDYAHLLDALPDDAYLSSLGMTKREITALKADRERLDTQRDIITESFKRFEDETMNINHKLDLSRTALDMNEEILTNRYNAVYQQALRYAGNTGSIRADNPYAAELGEITAELKGVENAKREVATRANDVRRANENRYLNAVLVHEKQVDYQLRQEIPDYDNIKQRVIDYAINEAGFNEWDFKRVNQPKLFKKLYTAMLADQNKAAATEKAKAMGAQAKHSRSMGSASQAPAAQTSNIKAQKVLANMGQSRAANVDAFAYLKD